MSMLLYIKILAFIAIVNGLAHFINNWERANDPTVTGSAT